MTSRTATVIGSTGLIGSHLTQMLLADEYYDKVRVIVRRPVTIASSKIEIRIIDFESEPAFRSAIEGSNVVFCAIGTTQKKVKGDENAYRKIDFDIPVNAARSCKDTGCNQFFLVSSVGANSKSKNFYLKLKGETENAVIENGPSTIGIFRPSILLGKRNESRPGEAFGKFIMKLFSFVLWGKWKKYKPVEAYVVASSMIVHSKTDLPGVHFYESLAK
jgi:uncharacterized protein YbjT (DUF2867 family)